jgi:hypothetical protein
MKSEIMMEVKFGYWVTKFRRDFADDTSTLKIEAACSSEIRMLTGISAYHNLDPFITF